MKIAIIGYTGAGKSTLAKILSRYYSCEIMHLDCVHFAPGWVERTEAEMISKVKPFLEKDSWIIEGNCRYVLHQQRMEKADQIIILAFNRFTCFCRAFRRYIKYKGKTRSDMTVGCDEKFNWTFIRWILWDGRSKFEKVRYHSIQTAFPNKTNVLNNQKQLEFFIKMIETGM